MAKWQNGKNIFIARHSRSFVNTSFPTALYLYPREATYIGTLTAMFVNENAFPFNQTQLLKCQHRLDVSLIGIDANTKKTNCQSNRMEAICTPEYYEKNASGSYLADSVENCSVFSVQNAAVEVDAMETRIKNKKKKNK
uniref:Uncharacterized protein n=1 Tax=Glossina palpalis gambiensis TaxID=67801 RepID=A0A1B0AMN1_9MUSC